MAAFRQPLHITRMSLLSHILTETSSFAYPLILTERFYNNYRQVSWLGFLIYLPPSRHTLFWQWSLAFAIPYSRVSCCGFSPHSLFICNIQNLYLFYCIFFGIVCQILLSLFHANFRIFTNSTHMFCKQLLSDHRQQLKQEICRNSGT